MYDDSSDNTINLVLTEKEAEAVFSTLCIAFDNREDGAVFEQHIMPLAEVIDCLMDYRQSTHKVH
jgi:hypothetical protein